MHLITGLTGSLGTALCDNILVNTNHTIIGTYCNDCKYAQFNCLYSKYINTRIFLYKTNLIDTKAFEHKLLTIFKNHKIDYVIHCAAMKYVNICEDNINDVISANISSSEVLVQIAKNNNVKNLIGLSTDKTIQPTNFYGMSKLCMEHIILKYGFGVYRGVNFFNSSGSVIDLWKLQTNQKKKIKCNKDCYRYFITLDKAAKDILQNIDSKTIILPDNIMYINIGNLAEAFAKRYNVMIEYDHCDKTEKNVEDIDSSILFTEIDVDGCETLFSKYLT